MGPISVKSLVLPNLWFSLVGLFRKGLGVPSITSFLPNFLYSINIFCLQVLIFESQNLFAVSTVVWSSLWHPLGSTQKVPCRRRCLTGGPFIHCKLAKWEQPKGALQAKVPYRGGALQGHDHCTSILKFDQYP